MSPTNERGDAHDRSSRSSGPQGEGDKRSFFGGGVHTWKLLAEDTDGAFFLFEDTMAQGKTTPLHLHPDADETVYVLEGEILVTVDGKRERVGAGGMTFTPRGTPHAFLVLSDTARLLTLQTPGFGQAFYRGASEALADDGSNRSTSPASGRWRTRTAASRSSVRRRSLAVNAG